MSFLREPLYSEDFMAALGFERAFFSMEVCLGHPDEQAILLLLLLLSLLFGKYFLVEMFQKSMVCVFPTQCR